MFPAPLLIYAVENSYSCEGNARSNLPLGKPLVAGEYYFLILIYDGFLLYINYPLYVQDMFTLKNILMIEN